jgi:hypothetical protein
MFQTEVVHKIKTRVLCSITFFPENCAVYEIMWKKYGRGTQATDDNITRRMRFACWVTRDTDTRPEYVILVAFPRQYWLHERASIWPHRYTACLLGNKAQGPSVPGASSNWGRRRWAPDTEVLNKQSRTADKGSSSSLWVA